VEPSAAVRPAALPLAASSVLGAVAGFVDAVCFDRLFEVFPANQSGNAVLLGIGLGDASGTAIWRPATAMVGYALGVVLAVVVRRSGRVRRTARALLGAEVVLLAVVVALVGPVTAIDQPLGGAGAAALLLLTCVAMGIQTEVIRTHAGVALSTTYQTGALTRIAEDAVAAGAGGAAERRAAVAPMTVLATVLVGYIGGAALGARLSDDWGWALVVPVVILAVLAAVEPWWNHRRVVESA
jgi:uncharacterized membrane protein YoaK (UPF0700 family)